jgi:hypothetical protein
MAGSTVQRNAGKTYALSVTSSSHAAVLIDDTTNDQINYTSFLNTGAAAIAIKMGPTDPGAAVLPVDGTPGDYVLPAGMTTPIILATPTTPYYLTAISASTTGIVYVTAAADQS